MAGDYPQIGRVLKRLAWAGFQLTRSGLSTFPGLDCLETRFGDDAPIEPWVVESSGLPGHTSVILERVAASQGRGYPYTRWVSA
jgi:hypothetical protein